MTESPSSTPLHHGTPRAIATLIYREGPISQPELGKRVRLSRAAVNKAVMTLRDSGLVRTVGVQRPLRGRPADVLEIDHSTNVVAVLTLDPQEASLTASVVSMDGVTVWSRSIGLNRKIGNEGLLDAYLGLADDILAVAESRQLYLRAMVLILPGSVRASDGALEISVHFPHIVNLPLEQAVRERTQVRVLSVADMQALCAGIMAEQGEPRRVAILIWGGGITWSPASPAEPFGQLLPRWRGFGHIQVVPDGRPCYCGGRGCVEAEIGGWALLDRLRAAAPDLAELDLLRLRDLASQGHPEVRRLLTDAAERLGEYFHFLAQATNPDAIVIQSGLGLPDDILLPAFRRGLEPHLHPTRRGAIDVSTLRDAAAVTHRGGVSLATELSFVPDLVRRMRPVSSHTFGPRPRPRNGGSHIPMQPAAP